MVWKVVRLSTGMWRTRGRRRRQRYPALRREEITRMRLDAEAKERIRRSYYLEHKSMRQIAREEGYSRPTIEKAIANQTPPPYSLTRPKPAPIFGSYKERVEALLHQN